MSWNKYQYLKKIFNPQKGKVKFDRVIARELINIAYDEAEDLSIKSLLKFLFSYDMKNFSNAFKHRKIIITNFTTREDHKNLIDQISKKFDNNSVCQLSKFKVVFRPSVKNLYLSILECKNYFATDLKLKHVLYIISSLTHYRNVEDSLKKSIDFDIKGIKYVALNSAIGFEALFCQILSSYTDVSVYSLTHANAYVNYKNFKPLDNINGENITATNVLVWGKQQKKELTKNFNFPKSRILVAGNPKYQRKKISVNQNFKNGLILLPRVIYNTQNLLLLDLLHELTVTHNFNFTVRLHPSLEKSEYDLICGKLNFKVSDSNLLLIDEIKKFEYDFGVSYNSTSYYEVMYNGLMCFRYKKSNDEFFGIDDEFDNALDLLRLMEKYKKMKSDYLNQLVFDCLDDVLGLSIDNYNNILD